MKPLTLLEKLTLAMQTLAIIGLMVFSMAGVGSLARLSWESFRFGWDAVGKLF